VLAGVGAALRPLGVEVVGQADVDGVDLRIGQQLVVAADPHRVAQGLTLAGRELGVREEPRAAVGVARDRRELDALGGEHRRDHDHLRDVRGSEHSYPQRGHARV
jgi:hypothetical protein